jgi:hypothetical protein
MFLGASLFLRTLVGMKVLWLAGRFGGGKTLLSFALGLWLQKQGYTRHIYSNIPSQVADPVPVPEPPGFALHSDPETGKPKAYASVIFDEAWILLDAREWNKNVARSIGAFLRKYDIFLLLPSVFSIDKRFRNFYVQRVLNCYAFGLPCYVYKWGLKMGFVDETGFFGLWRPSDYFGTYDHLATPGDDGGLVAAMAATSQLPDSVESVFTGDVGEYGEIEEGERVKELKKTAKTFKLRRRRQLV